MSNNISTAEMDELFSRLPDSEAEARIIELNDGLVRFMANKLYHSRGMDFEDSVSHGYIGLLKAIRTFDKEKGSFGTYAAKWISIEIYGGNRREEKFHSRCTNSFQEVIGEAEDLKYEDIIFCEEDEVEKIAFDSMLLECMKYGMKFLPVNQRRALEMHYGLRGGECIKQKDIAKILGCTYNNVSYLVRTGRNNLRKMYDTGFLQRRLREEKEKR